MYSQNIKSSSVLDKKDNIETVTLEPKRFTISKKIDTRAIELSNVRHSYHSERRDYEMSLKYELNAYIASKIVDTITIKVPATWQDHLNESLIEKNPKLKNTLEVNYITKQFVIEELYPEIKLNGNSPIRICNI